ncbi:hypothetical protein J5N97_010589 [Dioscorea zingiberensis]|uniref:Late embryogenesis abundant protein LEA-2 subgroup domain-containing protein n=1 Tax=Dioscorea zingiberensis TaxID=325984 RepID=A0A9D5D0C7_9LILI|nr:hypothetical protein J5N97_010589 [Dioscorea zingiberensis]
MASNIEQRVEVGVGGEEEALFHNTYPCSALYYVQSPSTASHANSSECRHPSDSVAGLSPFPADDTSFIVVPPSASHRSREASRFTLSRYSSSRGSNNSSFLHDKKIPYDDLHTDHHGNKRIGRLRVVADEEEDDQVVAAKTSGLWRFLAFDPSASCFCVAFQITWRSLLSLAIALLVFFLATRPPPPKVSFQISRVKHFNLGEGLDVTGVVTKILTCNSSIDMEIDNKSKLFGLHLHPVTIDMAFGRLIFATSSQGEEETYVESDNMLRMRLYVGVKDMPIYGAGRDMEDMLESGKGLPLTLRVRSRSSYHVVWNLVKAKYHHHAECLMVLNDAYDAHHHTQLFNSTCSTTTSHA